MANNPRVSLYRLMQTSAMLEKGLHIGMSKIHNNITELIGNTPLVRISNYAEKHGIKADLLVKLEAFNPLSSVKDRIGLAMIEAAERDGALKPGGTIVEATSGNTGIALAFVAAAKGYKIILTMPETMTIERRKLLAALGADLVLTPGSEGMKGAIAKADEIVAADETAVLARQFQNAANPAIHRETTAEEVWHDTDGQLDYFVGGYGTGGTLTGVAEVLKPRNPDLKIVAVEPADSPLLTEGRTAPHKIQGLAPGFKPDIFKSELVDETITSTTEEAFAATRELAKTEGILVGISSGAALAAATKLAKREGLDGKRIVVVLPDTGERYLSTALFAELED